MTNRTNEKRWWKKCTMKSGNNPPPSHNSFQHTHRKKKKYHTHTPKRTMKKATKKYGARGRGVFKKETKKKRQKFCKKKTKKQNKNRVPSFFSHPEPIITDLITLSLSI